MSRNPYSLKIDERTGMIVISQQNGFGVHIPLFALKDAKAYKREGGGSVGIYFSRVPVTDIGLHGVKRFVRQLDQRRSYSAEISKIPLLAYNTLFPPHLEQADTVQLQITEAAESPAVASRRLFVVPQQAGPIHIYP